MKYSKQNTEYIVSEYTADPTRECVQRLALELGVTPKSITSKLSAEKVYKSPPRTTKTGDKVVVKETLAKEIGDWLGLELPSLAKAAKLELQALHKALSDPYVVRAHLVDLEYEEGISND